MLYLPIPLLMHLHDHNIKMPFFDKAIEKWYDNIDVDDKPDVATVTFFDVYLKTPIPNDDNIFSFFSNLRELSLRGMELPTYLMPPEFLFNIEYDRVHEELISTPVKWESVFKPRTMRKAQLDLLSKLVQSQSRIKILVAPTGVGKTWTFLAYARAAGKKAMIIEPQKGMESQLLYQYDVPIIMGMHHYTCRAELKPASESACRVLGKESPCGKGCQWNDKVTSFTQEINSYHPVATNPGNFWTWINRVDLVIVDEFHQVFSQLTSQHEVPDNITEQDGLDWLSEEVKTLDAMQKAMYQELRSLKQAGMPIDRKKWRDYDAVQHELRWKELFLDNYKHVYIYPQNGHTFMKLDKAGTINYFTSLYPDKEIIFVSATPLSVQNADTIQTQYAVTTKVNAPIIYYPVANLSSGSVSANPEYLDVASETIMDQYRHFRDKGTTKKMIIHSGNTGTHGLAVAQKLESYGLKVMHHKKGALMETIEKFRDKNYDALVVASADAGYDFYGDTFGLQFILKVPYPSMGNEWVAIENKHGKSYRWELYAQETINQIIQASGRICRGADDIGITIILDQKFRDIYNSHLSKFPDSFKERLYDISGTLRNTAPSWQLEHYQKVE